MTIIVFLLDNSASMAQKSYVGVSYLDFARQFVETFLKLRQRDIAFTKTDRYMLMGFDDYPRNVKSGWKESQSQFNEQLRNLRPTGRSQFAEALFNAFRFVNLNRVQTGIENYGYGRFPSFSEPVVFISLLDATADSPRKSFLQNNKFPKLPAFGSELTEDPFRWDYKLFLIFLNMPGHLPQRLIQPVPPSTERKQAELIAEKMNGMTFDLTTHKSTTSIIDTILQRIQQSGVYVRFERFGAAPNPQLQSTNGAGDAVKPVDNWKSQIVAINRLVKTPATNNSQSFWPIPESFWPDQTIATIPPRKVYPEITFRCEPSEHISTTSIVFDKYELEPCPLTQFLVERKNTNECWQVFVTNSHKTPGIGYPFGYLKLSKNMQSVILFVFPYNYPLLFAIIEEAKDKELRDPSAFKAKVDRYFANVPPYYLPPLRKALGKIQITPPLTDRMPSPLLYNPALISQFKKWREQGREELEATCQQVANFINPSHPDATKAYSVICGVYQLPMVDVTRHLQTNLEKPTKIGLLRNYQPLQPLYKECKIAVTTTRYPRNPSSKFRNPYDIEREEIVDHLEKMRVNLDLQIMNTSVAVLEGGLPGQRIKLQHAEDLHSLPVAKMGDYQEYSKRLIDIGKGPMREFEPQVAKPHAFGNPFKLDKKNMTIDEVTELPIANTSATNGSPSPNPNAISKDNTVKLRHWKRRCSVSRDNSPASSRESSPAPPDPKRRRIDSTIRQDNVDGPSDDAINMVASPAITPPTTPSAISNNMDIVRPEVVDPRSTPSADLPPSPALTPDKSTKNGKIPHSRPRYEPPTAIITLDDDSPEVISQKKPSRQATSKNKRPYPTFDRANSSSSPSSPSSDESGKSNDVGGFTLFRDTNPPQNADFQRRPYPEHPQTSVEDPPTLSKQELIRRKFQLVRAIRHKDNATRYDPTQECLRLVNDLSWREQFECLDHGREQANKSGHVALANALTNELKKVAKCIRLEDNAKRTNGSTTMADVIH